MPQGGAVALFQFAIGAIKSCRISDEQLLLVTSPSTAETTISGSYRWTHGPLFLLNIHLCYRPDPAASPCWKSCQEWGVTSPDHFHRAPCSGSSLNEDFSCKMPHKPAEEQYPKHQVSTFDPETQRLSSYFKTFRVSKVNFTSALVMIWTLTFRWPHKHDTFYSLMMPEANTEHSLCPLLVW